MYNSKEIRWFSRGIDGHLIDWFGAKGLLFATTDARTDFYMPLPDRVDMSIKLREGNIEVKQRTGVPSAGSLMAGAKGYFEDWVKWSFNADKSDRLCREIADERKYDWWELYKERIGVKVGLDGTGQPIVGSLKDRLPFGCQVEYTRLLINGTDEWFTFALEWFGSEQLALSDAFIADILGNVQFDLEDSMGYGEFLSRLSK